MLVPISLWDPFTTPESPSRSLLGSMGKPKGLFFVCWLVGYFCLVVQLGLTMTAWLLEFTASAPRGHITASAPWGHVLQATELPPFGICTQLLF